MVIQRRQRTLQFWFTVSGMVVSLDVTVPVVGEAAEIEGVMFSDSFRAGSHRLYEDVKEGDRYGLTYLPGVGTELG